MLIQAAINGVRKPEEHPGIPITPERQASEVRASVAAGAGAIHVHIRGKHGQDSLSSDDVAAGLEAIRKSCPETPIGVSTGAWIADRATRISCIRAWRVLPDFASVNIHEEGSFELIALLLEKGIGVEAGLWDSVAAKSFLLSGFANQCLRILLEPAERAKNVRANLEDIEAALGDLKVPRLLHGSGETPLGDGRIGCAAELRYPRGL